MKMYVMSILVWCLNDIIFALLRSNLPDKRDELRKRINKMFNGKQGDEMFLNIDDYEYPRTNKTLRQIHKQQWLDYYECLEKTYADIGRERINYPSALVALEGTSVTLTCQICISPTEAHMINLIEWYFNSSRESNITKSIEDTNHIVSSTDKQYVIMYNLKLEQAGSYWCEMGSTVGSIYYLHIDSDSEIVNVVYPDTAAYAPQAAPDRIVPEYNLKIFTTWSTWSSCSTCDVVGIKLRYGYCTISLLETSARSEYIDNESASMTDELQYVKRETKEEWNRTLETTIQTMMINESLKIRLRTALLLFKNKLPCKSRFVPKRMQAISVVKNRRTEIMKQYCKKRCRKNIIFEVRDEKGNVLESANNSAGIYSMIQGMPVPSPSVTRNTVYEKHNKKIKLVCPGNLNADIPITWQIGDKIINPSHIKNRSSGRIHINPQMHIIFQSLKFEDANIYSCWQGHEIAGIIRLNVTGELEFKLNHHVILISAIIIISVFLIIFWRVYKGRTRYTIH